MTNRLLPLLLLLALLPSLGRADVSATAPPVRPAPTESGLAAGSPLLPPRVLAQAADTGALWQGTTAGNKPVSPALTLSGIEAALGFAPLSAVPVPLTLAGTNPASSVLTVQATAGQTAPVTTWLSPTGAVMASVDADGNINAKNYAALTSNTFAGMQAGFSNTTGTYNTFAGYQAGYFNTTGTYNTFAGYQAGYFNTTGNYNTFAGMQAGYFNTTGGNNTYAGMQTGYFNTTGGGNTFAGMQAGFSNTYGSNNTFAGMNAGYFNTGGSGNTFAGTNAGVSNTTGSYNTFAGMNAGYGTSGATANTTGNSNTYLGMYTSLTGSTQYSNSIALGYMAQVGASNACIIGGTGANAVSVGIGGITAPAAQLHVVNSSPSQPVARFDEAAGASGLQLNLNDSVGNPVWNVSAAGAVTAGSFNTTSPGYTGNIPMTAQNIHYSGGVCIGYTDSTGTTVGN